MTYNVELKQKVFSIFNTSTAKVFTCPYPSHFYFSKNCLPLHQKPPNKEKHIITLKNFTFRNLMSQAQTTNLNTTQSHDWISKDCYYYDKLNFNENKISCFKEYASAYSYHNIGNKFKFTIKIIKQQSTIGIGISSTRNTNLKFLCFPFIRFKSNTETNINMDLKSTNQQFKQNDQVSVIGDLPTKTITLAINNKVANVLSYKQISASNRKWSTYIYLQKQAQVQIMNNFTQIELMSTFMSESLFAWDYDLLYHIYHIIQFLQLCSTEDID